MTGWPALHTPAQAAQAVRWWHYLAACIAVLVVPTVVGLPVAFALSRFETAAVEGAVAFAFYLGFAFYLSWFGLLAGVPLTVLTLRRGIAGWGVAAAAGGITGGLVQALLELPQAAPVGVTLALIYWLTLRLLAPRAFGA